MGNKETFLPIIKERFKKALKDAGKTQKQLSEELFISPEHLTRCLTKGKISRPWLMAIAQALNISEKFLSGETDTEFLFWADHRNDHNIEELLSNYMVSLGWSPAQQAELSSDDWEKIKLAIKMIIDGVFAEMHNRKENGEKNDQNE